jgi:hypothetical protein
MHGVGKTLYWVKGGALRLGYDPQVPQLEEIGGSKCYLLDSKVSTKTMRTSSLVPVIAAKWELLYAIETALPLKDMTDYKGNLETSSRI